VARGGGVLESREINLPELSKSQLSSPDFLLASEAVGTDQLELIDELLTFEWPPRLLRGLAIVRVLFSHLDLIFGV